MIAYIPIWAKVLFKPFRGARLEPEMSGITSSGGATVVCRFGAGRAARWERATTAARVPDDGPPVAGPGPNVCVNLVEVTVTFVTHLFQRQG